MYDWGVEMGEGKGEGGWGESENEGPGGVGVKVGGWVVVWLDENVCRLWVGKHLRRKGKREKDYS